MGFYHANHNIQPLRPQSLGFRQHRRVFPTPAQAPKKTFSFPRCGAAACSSRRSGSGRKGSLFIKLIQCQIEFDNVDDRLADIFHQRLLAVFCDQLRELFNAEITRFRHAWICRAAACG